MLSHKIYYRLKPFLPRQLRLTSRRIIARAQRPIYAESWPIDEAAGQQPRNWHGWPEGKKFAFVLTHDVESPEGLKNCHQLIELERKLGFRSIFNFIPEGDYCVPKELREELVEDGFEVGVHDLRHDGKLYWTRGSFSKSAKRINNYLKEWKANGFRSGFMHHKLDWLHELRIRYDMSTFDTDPFEPQPDAAGTIFPFWVPGPRAGHGYVELPYTLPQDSTLFILFREPSIDIWRKKIDWIANQGGMALIITHPDYMRFSDSGRKEGKFPASLYEDLLQYVKEMYAGDYWHALPRDIAEHVRKNVILRAKTTGDSQNERMSPHLSTGKRERVIA